MQLTELQTFLAIVETGSLVKASQQLNVTQSTVTARLKSLEEELGQALIIRQKSGATLTAAGERLRRYASTISDLWRQARQETALPHALSSVCNIGSHPDLWPNLGSVMFDHIRTDYPQVALSVWHGSERDMTRWLADGLIDVALTYWPNANQVQTSIPLMTDRLLLFSSDKEASATAHAGYVFVEAGEEFGKQHAAFYANTDTAARISFGTAQLGLEHLLKAGGSAYLPMRIAKPYVEANQLFEVPDSKIFERSAFVVANKSALSSWPWFEGLVATLMNTLK
ncbi:MAG: LysR family transcriptional regulator [Pseudomonadota bacterium]